MDVVKTEKLVLTKEEYNAWSTVFYMIKDLKLYSEITEIQESADKIYDLMNTIDNYITMEFCK